MAENDSGVELTETREKKVNVGLFKDRDKPTRQIPDGPLALAIQQIRESAQEIEDLCAVSRPESEKTPLIGLVDDSDITEQNDIIELSAKFTERWAAVRNWVIAYSWTLLIQNIVITFGAHILIIIDVAHGKNYQTGGWTTCHVNGENHKSLLCTEIFHFWEVPIIIFTTIIAIYGLRQFSFPQSQYYFVMSGFQVLINCMFTMYEIKLWSESTTRPAPLREIILFSIGIPSMMIASMIGGIFWLTKMLPIMTQSNPILGGVMRADDGYYHPKNINQVVNLVRAVRHKAKDGVTPRFIRVRGSLHSFPHQISGIPVDPSIGTTHTRSWFAQFCVCCVCKCCEWRCVKWIQASLCNCKCCIVKKGFQSPLDESVVAIYMEQMRAVQIDSKAKTVRVQAGCNLGDDPLDFTGTATLQNSLLYQLDQAGFALPDLGGITHQTVGGFLSTGSSGGSITYSLDEVVQELTIVDGLGVVHIINKTTTPELFHCCGVAVGVMGIVVEVVFNLIPRFDIRGTETISLAKTCQLVDTTWCGGTDVDEKKQKKPTVEEFCTNTEYTRWMWWPQPGVEKLVIWQAHRMTQADYEELKVDDPLKPNQIQTYHEVGTPPVLLQALGGLLIQMADANWAKQPNKSPIFGLFAEALSHLFVADGPVKQFHDWWYSGIPMDNQMEDYLLPTVFTELWVDLKDATRVLNILYKYFNQDENTIWSKVGIFSYELYAAKKSDFWLSMSHGKHTFRIDIFWYARCRETFDQQPIQFYRQFWELLYKENIPFRPHWGKYLDERPIGVRHRREAYPMMDSFLTVRRLLDPDNIFLTAYWRRVFGEGGLQSDMARAEYLNPH